MPSKPHFDAFLNLEVSCKEIPFPFSIPWKSWGNEMWHFMIWFSGHCGIWRMDLMALGVFSNLCESVKARHYFSILLRLYPTELIGFFLPASFEKGVLNDFSCLPLSLTSVCGNILYLECRICPWGGSWACLGSHTASFLLLGHWLISSYTREQWKSCLWHHDFCARKLYPKVVTGQAIFFIPLLHFTKNSRWTELLLQEDVPHYNTLDNKIIFEAGYTKDVLIMNGVDFFPSC